MKQKNQFTNRLQELEEQFEHPEDFFRLLREENEVYPIGPGQNQQLNKNMQKSTEKQNSSCLTGKPASAQEQDDQLLSDTEWLPEDTDFEGQLAVDVYQKGEQIIVQAALAGVKPENVDVTLNNDTLTIKGKRENKLREEGADYFIEECYWGGFSRSIILPVDVRQDEIDATFDNGIITITLPIAKKSKHTKIEVKEVKND